MNKKVEEILNKKMDRKDFLRHIGIGALLLGGAGAALKALGELDTKKSQKKVSQGYGSMAYGGKKEA